MEVKKYWVAVLIGTANVPVDKVELEVRDGTDISDLRKCVKRSFVNALGGYDAADLRVTTFNGQTLKPGSLLRDLPLTTEDTPFNVLAPIRQGIC